VKLPVGWLREFVDTPSDARAIGARLSSCGFEVASIEGDVIDLEITANRPDCLTIAGLAREAATAFDLPLKSDRPGASPQGSSPTPRASSNAQPQPTSPAPVSVSIEDRDCGRFRLALVEVKIAPSPSWLTDRLIAVGLRPINNVVDVTNYVMHELHPMHAYDAAKLHGRELHIRRAAAGETLVTLDGQTRKMEGVLVAADRDRAVSVGGIIGGANSEVESSTTTIALESAWWQPAQIRLASRKIGLKTEASIRFERGADIDGPIFAINRALELLEAMGGRSVAPIVDVYPQRFVPRSVRLRRAALERLLGDRVPDTDVERILERLGFEPSASDDGWTVRVPTFRVDVHREADLIEEVGRHWGFDRIPATFPALRTAPRPSAAAIPEGRAVRRVLTSAGLQEAATFTFIEGAAAEPFVRDASQLVPIANPLSEKFGVLRPSLLPGLLDALVYNRRRETADVRLFEAGSIFGPEGERQAVSWVLTGRRGEHWTAGTDSSSVDFFDAKGIAELLASAFGMSIEAHAAELPWFVPGRAAVLVSIAPESAGAVGYVGQIRPDIGAARGLSDGTPVVAGELDLARLGSTAHEPRVTPLPRYPSIVRDLSILVDERLPAAAVRGTIRANAPATLVAIREFDRYQGRGVPANHVSLSLRLTFRAADRTLVDAEVQQAFDAIVAALAREHGAVLRGKSAS
jgi:phenylalanyl-tRNA synthetase beta chain